MIHLNIRHQREDEHDGDYRRRWDDVNQIIEVSTDGGGWRTLYVCDAYYGYADVESTPDVLSRTLARAMFQAWDYAGIEWRATAHGEALTR